MNFPLPSACSDNLAQIYPTHAARDTNQLYDEQDPSTFASLQLLFLLAASVVDFPILA
jgi:hypothetical protein